MSGLSTITLNINGQTRSCQVTDDLALIELLQEDLGLTGTKLCCGIGVCKACTVAVKRVPTAQSQPVLACSTPALLLDGQSINTIEGVAQAGQLSKVQQSFLDHFAFQCGYCTPGFVMATEMLLERLRAQKIPSAELDDAIADAVGQHICRCTGYARYYEAIRAVVVAEGLVIV